MTVTFDTARAVRASLARRLTAPGDPWRAALEEVPRHLFVPSFLRRIAGQWESVTGDDPGYLDAVYADAALTTQVADDLATSSSNRPSQMLAMLRALDVREGHRVLEIGTGTGYHAALLCHRLGSDLVTTVDVDLNLTGRATRRLTEAGYHPVVHSGDGADGVPARAPYDRIVATCSMRSVPWPWLEQSRPGAVILAPIGSGLARLTVTGAGAEGRFLPDLTWGPPPATDAAPPERFALLEHIEPRRTKAAVDAAVLERLALPLSLAVPGYRWRAWQDERTGATTALDLWTPDGSMARARAGGGAVRGGGARDGVRESGPRQLWSLVEELDQALPETCGPASQAEFGLTLGADRQRVWYGDPKGPSWDLPPVTLLS